MEISEKKIRSIVGIAASVPWALGIIYFGMLGYFIRDWRYLQVASSVPGLTILIFLWFYDESPRWLIIKGKHKEAHKVLTKAARYNNATLPPTEKLYEIMREIQESANTSKPSVKEIVIQDEHKYWHKFKHILLQMAILFRTPTIRRRTLLMYVDFIVASTVFYGLSLNGRNFSADVHIYIILTGLMELPAYTVTAPIVGKFGRRIPTSLCYLICGITIMTLAFIPPVPAWLIISMAMVGKLCISAAYQTVYLISSEIFPTEVRLQGLGTSNLIARIGAISAPFITDLLGPVYPWFPSLIFGGASLVASAATLLLPETLMQPLPETVAQLEASQSSKSNKDANNEDVENSSATHL